MGARNAPLLRVGDIIICGGDEAGRGAVIGPLVISLVTVRSAAGKKLADIGVRDSKMLTPRMREELYGEIMDAAEQVLVDRIMPAEINDSMRSDISLNELEASRFARLFESVGGDVGKLYLDSPDVVAARFGMRFAMSCSKPVRVRGAASGRRLQHQARRAPLVIAEHKADARYAVVSAASIIAKVIRDRAIRRIERATGIRVGSGYPSDAVTIGAISANIRNEELARHIRVHWRTMDAIRQTRLYNY